MTENNPHQQAPLTQHQAAKREMVEKHGEKNQIERYYAGLLPEDELLALARRVLFAPLNSFPRYNNVASSRDSGPRYYLLPEDVKHSDDCAWGAPQVKFFTREAADGISGNEWIAYRRIQDVVTEAWRTMPSGSLATIDIVEHVGLCAFCKYREATSRSASVRITWAGYELLREYALGGA